ncbi:MAG: hypothetical protein U0821_12310 [Chloroflexota bacterium]
MPKRLMLAAIAVLLLSRFAAVQAAIPMMVADGTLPGGASIVASADDSAIAVLKYVEMSDDGPREILVEAGAKVECLGKLFGGQAARVSGQATDSANAREPLSAQLYLVDGADRGPDRLSLKLTRRNGSIVHFVPMTDLEAGDIAVNCGG